ncbi:MAG: epoxide hydrolase N-terminal domain-containing protein, partial [Acidimicrobiales bacterium]
MTPFRIEASDEQLDDLRRRLHHTRWPDAETVDDWSQGIPLAYTQELCRYWADDYDWRARESRINSFPQFRTEIDGLGIHFLHVRSPHANAFPLVLTHGWPGSVVEFLDAVG